MNFPGKLGKAKNRSEYILKLSWKMFTISCDLTVCLFLAAGRASGGAALGANIGLLLLLLLLLPSFNPKLAFLLLQH